MSHGSPGYAFKSAAHSQWSSRLATSFASRCQATRSSRRVDHASKHALSTSLHVRRIFTITPRHTARCNALPQCLTIVNVSPLCYGLATDYAIPRSTSSSCVRHASSAQAQHPAFPSVKEKAAVLVAHSDESMRTLLEKELANFKGKLRRLTNAQGLEDITVLRNQRRQEAIWRHGHTRESFRACLQFLALEDETQAVNFLQARMQSDAAFSPPPQVLSHFLSRKTLKAVSLHCVLEALRRPLLAPTRDRSIPSEEDIQGYIGLFTRFVYHGRRVSRTLVPKAAQTIVELCTPTVQEPLRAAVLAAMSKMTNAMMANIALQTATRPFQDAHMQERALVQILKYMADHDPPLLVSREGYEAFIKVQLRLPKTAQDRYWARLKALSWPPWKQDRTGMDARLDPSVGHSRAKQSLDRMTQDGFPAETFDRIAAIYAGHDVHGTPTIQTRALMPKMNDNRESDWIWTARIQTTRTIQEAWACWLAYESATSDNSPASPVVLAMMEKICAAQIRSSASNSTVGPQDEYDEILPGDTDAVAAIPLSTHLHTYTRTPPPQDLMQFFQYLQQQDVQLDKRCTTFLLDHAKAFRHGFLYLSAYRDDKNRDLPNLVRTLDGEAVFDHLSPRMVSATANLLLRFPKGGFRPALKCQQWCVTVPASLTSTYMPLVINPRVLRAIWLLNGMAPTSDSSRATALWRPIFACLVSDPSAFIHLNSPAHLHRERTYLEDNYPGAVKLFHKHRARVLQFRIAQQVVQLMKEKSVGIDEYIFEHICRTLSRAGESHRWALQQQALARKLANGIRTLPYELILNETSDIVAEGPHVYLKSLYDDMTGASGLMHKAPAGEYAPLSPPTVHLWVRAIGAWGHHQSIIDFVHWLCADKVVHTGDDKRSERRHLQRFIISTRVFLERVSQDILESDAEETQQTPAELLTHEAARRFFSASHTEAPRKLIALLEQQFSSKGVAWPDDEAVEAYIAQHRASEQKNMLATAAVEKSIQV